MTKVMEPGIWLNDAEAKRFGCRVLLPGTAGYAAFRGGEAPPAPVPEPIPEPEPEDVPIPVHPAYEHHIGPQGRWTISLGGEVVEKGQGKAKLAERLATLMG